MVDTESEKFKACLKIVLSQTNYDEKTATDKLVEYNEDFIKIIKEYLNGGKTVKNEENKTVTKKTINQQIISQIRDFKDKQDKTYLSRKENVEKMKKLYELHLNKKSE